MVPVTLCLRAPSLLARRNSTLPRKLQCCYVSVCPTREAVRPLDYCDEVIMTSSRPNHDYACGMFVYKGELTTHSTEAERPHMAAVIWISKPLAARTLTPPPSVPPTALSPFAFAPGAPRPPATCRQLCSKSRVRQARRVEGDEHVDSRGVGSSGHSAGHGGFISRAKHWSPALNPSAEYAPHCSTASLPGLHAAVSTASVQGM